MAEISKKPGEPGFSPALAGQYAVCRLKGWPGDLVSVILPVYNCAKYLASCLACLTNQTYPLLEILIIDDGSDDGSFETASGFAASDSRVTVARTEKARSGPGVARNLGLDLCHGRWIKFMDADDLISFNAIASLVNASRKMKGRNVLPVLRHQTVECVRPFDLPLFTPLGSPGNLDVRVPWNVHGLLFDHSVVGPLRFEDLKFGEDSLFVVDYLDRLGWTGSGGFLPTSQCYFYRKSPKSLTRDNPEKAANARKTVEAIDANPRSGYCDVLRSRVERVRRVSAARASGR